MFPRLPKLQFPFLFMLLFVPVSLPAQQQPSQQLMDARKGMPDAFKDPRACESLYEKLRHVRNPDPLLKGYMGGVYIARSKHASLVDKPGLLRKGTHMLEEAIREMPGSIELIFLRMTIQLNLPSFLGYNDNVEHDKLFVLENYKNAPPVLRERIITFIRSSEHFTETEKSAIAE